jgi:hypothetical protein
MPKVKCSNSVKLRVFIKEFSDKYFSVISKSISRLEAVGMQHCNALQIVKKVESELHQAQGEVAVKISAKLQNVLQRNPGYSTLCTISDILCGKEVELDNSKLELDASDFTCFKYAPVTSCGVERSFSKYKAIVSVWEPPTRQTDYSCLYQKVGDIYTPLLSRQYLYPTIHLNISRALTTQQCPLVSARPIVGGR